MTMPRRKTPKKAQKKPKYNYIFLAVLIFAGEVHGICESLPGFEKDDCERRMANSDCTEYSKDGFIDLADCVLTMARSTCDYYNDLGYANYEGNFKILLKKIKRFPQIFSKTFS